MPSDPFTSVWYWLTGKAVQGSGWAGDKAFSGAERVAPSTRAIDHLRSAASHRRELRELQNLYHQLDKHAAHAEETYNQVSMRAIQSVLPPTADKALRQSACRLCVELLEYEGLFRMPEVSQHRELSISEIWELTATLRRQLKLLESPQTRQLIEKLLGDFLRTLIPARLRDQSAEDAGEAFTSVPLYMQYADPAEAIEAIIRTTFHTPEKDGTFDRLGDKLNNNLHLASGIDPDRSMESQRALVMPTQATGNNPSELIVAYLAGTPFLDFCNIPLPYSIPQKARFEHMHVVGSSGHGKTQLLQSFILRDLGKVSKGEASMIVIDSQGDLIRNILSLASVGAMADRVILIDPNEYTPALNLFDFGLGRLKGYADERDRKRIRNGAIQLYKYMFGALLRADVTQRQDVIFSSLASLMMAVPGATIKTLRDFMKQPELTREHISKLDEDSREFFETEFFASKYDATREQLATRLWGLILKSDLASMFAAERNKLDMYDAMNRGSLILINTAKGLLKQDCEIFGRFFIALIGQATLEREQIAQGNRRDTFVYIDEAHEYFDESLGSLFEEARKFRVGIVLAHQHLGQFDRKLQATVMTNTAIKVVGGLSDEDARDFARQMRCKPEFLYGMQKYEQYSEFACFVRNTPRPVCLTVPFGQMEAQPRSTAAARAALIAQNRERYCAGGEQNGSEPDRAKDDDSPLGDPELL